MFKFSQDFRKKKLILVCFCVNSDLITNIMIPIFTFLCLLATAILLLYFYLARNNDYWKKRGVVHLKPQPFFGNVLSIYTIKQSIGDFCMTIYKQYKKEPYVGFFVCDEPALNIHDLDLIKNILIKDFGNFIDRTMINNPETDPMGSHILFVIQNPDWKPLRRKVTPVFTSGKMKAMYQLMLESGGELLKYMDRFVEENPVIECRELCAKYTTDLITSVAFGLRANCFEDDNSPFRVVSRRIFNFDSLLRGIANTSYFMAPTLVKLARLRFIDKYSGRFLRDVFWKTLREREEKGIVRNDVIDVLLQVRKYEEVDDPCKLDGDKLVAQAAQFFIAGYETTSTTISFALYELAKNQEIQETLRKEILDFKKEKGEFTYDALKDMTYLEMVVKETLRKYPVVPFLDRRCTTDYKVPGHDLTIKAGTPVYIPAMGIHYDPEYYPEPDKFIPERFTEENMANRSQYIYLPFGLGPRNCIGARFGLIGSKSGVAHILSKYRVETCDQTQKVMKLNPNGFLLAPIKGLRLKFTKLED